MLKLYRWNEGADGRWMNDLSRNLDAPRSDVEETLLHYAVEAIMDHKPVSWYEGVFDQTNLQPLIQHNLLSSADNDYLKYLSQINNVSILVLRGYILKLVIGYHLANCAHELKQDIENIPIA